MEALLVGTHLSIFYFPTECSWVEHSTVCVHAISEHV